MKIAAFQTPPALQKTYESITYLTSEKQSAIILSERKCSNNQIKTYEECARDKLVDRTATCRLVRC